LKKGGKFKKRGSKFKKRGSKIYKRGMSKFEKRGEGRINFKKGKNIFLKKGRE
jgi:hypothetical protein